MTPLYHQLAEEMKQENVVFLNVCVGTWVEVDLWRKMSENYQIEENTSFVNGWKSDFVKKYQISGVPRYMIFDKEGRIVSVKAPNPTTPRLKEMIVKTLTK
jgi:thioredoxin-related protein